MSSDTVQSKEVFSTVLLSWSGMTIFGQPCFAFTHFDRLLVQTKNDYNPIPVWESGNWVTKSMPTVLKIPLTTGSGLFANVSLYWLWFASLFAK